MSDAPPLTVPQAAAALALSQATVRRMIGAGDLPAVRNRRTVRIPASAIEAALCPSPVRPALSATESNGASITDAAASARAQAAARRLSVF